MWMMKININGNEEDTKRAGEMEAKVSSLCLTT
jgi:hypothetical protein